MISRLEFIEKYQSTSYYWGLSISLLNVFVFSRNIPIAPSYVNHRDMKNTRFR